MIRTITAISIALLLCGCAGSSTNKAEDDENAPLKPAVPVAESAAPPQLQGTSDATFAQDVLNSKEPVFVDFNTTWCVPCKQMAPMLAELATSYAGKVKFVSIDAEKNPVAAQKFSVTGYPTFLIFINGKVETKIMGAKTRTELESLIASSHAI